MQAGQRQEAEEKPQRPAGEQQTSLEMNLKYLAALVFSTARNTGGGRTMMNSKKSQNTLATPLIAVAIIRQKNQSKSKTEEKEQLLIKSSTDHPRQSSPLSNTISPKVDLAVVIFRINTNTTCLSLYCSLSRSACVGLRYKSPTCLSAKDEKIRW